MEAVPPQALAVEDLHLPLVEARGVHRDGEEGGLLHQPDRHVGEPVRPQRRHEGRGRRELTVDVAVHHLADPGDGPLDGQGEDGGLEERKAGTGGRVANRSSLGGDQHHRQEDAVGRIELGLDEAAGVLEARGRDRVDPLVVVGGGMLLGGDHHLRTRIELVVAAGQERRQGVTELQEATGLVSHRGREELEAHRLPGRRPVGLEEHLEGGLGGPSTIGGVAAVAAAVVVAGAGTGEAGHRDEAGGENEHEGEATHGFPFEAPHRLLHRRSAHQREPLIAR